jgi:hypothetical protein
MDGRAGNECFILPKADHECGAPTGTTTDLHFTVLPFISRTGEPSSAQLASNNHYTLDETVLDMVFQRNAALAATQVAAEQQKKAADANKTEGLQAALRKFDSCPNGLTAPELRALVMAGSKSSDSPVKKKKQELQEQLYREPRYSRVKLLAEEV